MPGVGTNVPAREPQLNPQRLCVFVNYEKILLVVWIFEAERLFTPYRLFSHWWELLPCEALTVSSKFHTHAFIFPYNTLRLWSPDTCSVVCSILQQWSFLTLPNEMADLFLSVRFVSFSHIPSTPLTGCDIETHPRRRLEWMLMMMKKKLFLARARAITRHKTKITLNVHTHRYTLSWFTHYEARVKKHSVNPVGCVVYFVLNFPFIHNVHP